MYETNQIKIKKNHTKVNIFLKSEDYAEVWQFVICHLLIVFGISYSLRKVCKFVIRNLYFVFRIPWEQRVAEKFDNAQSSLSASVSLRFFHWKFIIFNVHKLFAWHETIFVITLNVHKLFIWHEKMFVITSNVHKLFVSILNDVTFFRAN